MESPSILAFGMATKGNCKRFSIFHTTTSLESPNNNNKMPEQSIEKLKSLIKDIKYCMLATTTTSKLGEKYIHSRPMNVLWKEDALAEQKLYLFSSKGRLGITFFQQCSSHSSVCSTNDAMTIMKTTIIHVTTIDSWKNKEIQGNHEINLSFSDPSNHTYVSLSCTCYIDDSNRELMKELWNPYCEIYFPKGVNDPNLCLLVCDIHHAGMFEIYFVDICCAEYETTTTIYFHLKQRTT